MSSPYMIYNGSEWELKRNGAIIKTIKDTREAEEELQNFTEELIRSGELVPDWDGLLGNDYA